VDLCKDEAAAPGSRSRFFANKAARNTIAATFFASFAELCALVPGRAVWDFVREVWGPAVAGDVWGFLRIVVGTLSISRVLWCPCFGRGEAALRSYTAYCQVSAAAGLCGPEGNNVAGSNNDGGGPAGPGSNNDFGGNDFGGMGGGGPAPAGAANFTIGGNEFEPLDARVGRLPQGVDICFEIPAVAEAWRPDIAHCAPGPRTRARFYCTCKKYCNIGRCRHIEACV
jgi:hypothetical protein